MGLKSSFVHTIDFVTATNSQNGLESSFVHTIDFVTATNSIVARVFCSVQAVREYEEREKRIKELNKEVYTFCLEHGHMYVSLYSTAADQ